MIYTLAGTLPMASALILLPFYIHHLSTEVYGALTVYMAFTLFIQIAAAFSFDSSVYIHYHEFKNDKRKLSVFISSAFVFMILIGLGVSVVLALTGDLIFETVLQQENVSFYPYGLASVGSGVLQALFKVHSSLLQSREKPETFFWSNVLSFGLIASFTLIGLELFPNSLMGPIVGRFAAAVITAAWVLFRIFKEFGFHYDFGWLRTSFSFNTYTYIYQLLQWTINHFDRILMLLMLSLSEVGIYAFAIQCLIALELLMNSLHSSFYPQVVSNIMGQKEKHSTPEVNRYYHGLTAVIMLCACIGIFTLPWIIETFVYKKAYQQTIPYLPYLAAIYFFRTMRLYFTAPYGILKYTKPLPVIYFIVAAVKIVLMLLLMPSMKIYGVIVASLVSAVLELLMLRFAIGDKFTFQYNFFKVVGLPMLLFAAIITLEPLLADTAPYLLHLFYLLFTATLLWWAYRNEIQLLNPFRSGN